MMEINGELLYQFHQLGLSINEGVTVDARLVKSASRPEPKDKVKVLKEHSIKLNKNGLPKKFSRDIDSDWTIKNDKSHYDSPYLPYAVIYSMHTDKIKKVMLIRDIPVLLIEGFLL
jgi:hypothetical protein